MSAPVDRIRKLLALAQNNSSPEEAALCAIRAQELMFKYQIGEADLDIEASAPAREEGVVDEAIYTEDGKRDLWKACLAHALADGFGCRMYNAPKWGGDGRKLSHSFQVVGVESAVQTVAYMFSYLKLEIERLTEEAWNEADVADRKRAARTWRNNFRMGAVNTIGERVRGQRKQQVADLRQRAEAEPECTALVLFRATEVRVAEGYEKIRKAKGLRAGGSYRYSSNASAYERGQSAGRGVSLGGNHRAIGGSKSRLEA